MWCQTYHFGQPALSEWGKAPMLFRCFQFLRAFAKFLVDINVAEVSLKEATRDKVAPAEGPEEIQQAVQAIFQEWLTWAPQDVMFPSVPDGSFEMIAGPLPVQEFRHSLLRWLEDLPWPALPLRHSDVGEATHAELFMAFTNETNLLPPFRVGRGSSETWFAARSQEARQLPRSWLEAVREFAQHVDFLEKLLGRDLFLAPKLCGLNRLQPHGLNVQTTGVAVKPLLSGASSWLPVLLLLCRGETNALESFIGSRNCGEPFIA